MGPPSENIRHYEKADLTKVASSLAGRHFMLVYGTADTVVKPQHSMMLSRALVDQGVLFRQLVSCNKHDGTRRPSLFTHCHSSRQRKCHVDFLLLGLPGRGTHIREHPVAPIPRDRPVL